MLYRFNATGVTFTIIITAALMSEHTLVKVHLVRGVGRGVSLGSGNPLQVQYITQLGEVTPVILQMTKPLRLNI